MFIRIERKELSTCINIILKKTLTTNCKTSILLSSFQVLTAQNTTRNCQRSHAITFRAAWWTPYVSNIQEKTAAAFCLKAKKKGEKENGTYHWAIKKEWLLTVSCHCAERLHTVETCWNCCTQCLHAFVPRLLPVNKIELS